jgi:hypothetical protein
MPERRVARAAAARRRLTLEHELNESLVMRARNLTMVEVLPASGS